MATPMTASLAFRRRGTSEWVDIDPHSTTGRRFLRAVGITPNPMEDEMTAAAAATQREPRMRLAVDNTASPSMRGFALQVRAAGRRAWDWLTRLPRAAWNKADEWFHVRSATSWFRGIWGWVRNKVAAAGRILGWSGASGVGMLAVSTEIGRGALRLAFTPVRWGFGLFAKGWNWSIEQLHLHLGAPGTWVADRMVDLEEFLIGKDTHSGIIGRGWGLYQEWVAPWLTLDGIIMAGVRTAGFALTSLKAMGLLTLLPLGGFLLPAQYLVMAGGLALTGYHGWGFANRAYNMGKALFTGRDDRGHFASLKSVATDGAATEAASTTVGAASPAATTNRADRRSRGKNGSKTPAGRR